MSRQQFRQQEESRVTASRRYDTETVRKVLARATELEQRDQEALTAAQVEELGRELGIQPDAVRRALGEVDRGITTSYLPQTRPAMRSRRAAQIIGIPALSYALFNALYAFQLTARPPTNGPAWVVFAIVFFLPPLVALLAGWRLRSPWLGSVGGIIITTLSLLGLTIGAWIAKPGQPLWTPETFPWIAETILAGIILGSIGGAARQAWETKQFEVADRHLAEER